MARWLVLLALLLGFGYAQFAPVQTHGGQLRVHTLDDSPQLPHG